MNGQFAFAIALESKQLVRNETVHHRQRQAFQQQTSINLSVILIVGTRQQAYLLVVLHQSSLNGMSIVLLLQIDQLGAHITDRAMLVGHVAYRHVADHRKMSVSIQNDMIVAIQQSRHLGQIVRQYGAHLTQIHFVQRDGDILQGSGIAVLGIDLHTRSIVGYEVYFGLYLFVGG